MFTVPLFFQSIQARKQGFDVQAHPDHYFLETYLTRNHLGPLPHESFPFGLAYGYHFDSALLGKWLAKKAISRGVKRIFADVVDAQTSPSGDISRVNCKDGQCLSADFFVDCSGFQSLLMQKTLQVEFTSFKENLFNDAAVVLPTNAPDTYPVETKSTALNYGWAWQIPLRQRMGNGYVYSTDYTDADSAETEFRQHLHMLDSDVEARHLSMKVGRVNKHWYKNCLAVGLSQGFIEPLEATAIALSYNTISQFIDCFTEGRVFFLVQGW